HLHDVVRADACVCFPTVWGGFLPLQRLDTHHFGGFVCHHAVSSSRCHMTRSSFAPETVRSASSRLRPASMRARMWKVGASYIVLSILLTAMLASSLMSTRLRLMASPSTRWPDRSDARRNGRPRLREAVRERCRRPRPCLL